MKQQTNERLRAEKVTYIVTGDVEEMEGITVPLFVDLMGPIAEEYNLSIEVRPNQIGGGGLQGDVDRFLKSTIDHEIEQALGRL